MPAPNSHAQAFRKLNQAILSISGELDLPKTLQQIVDAARKLAGARYAALGVFDADGRLDQFFYSGLSAEAAARIARPPEGLGLLKALLVERESIRLPRIHTDPRSVGFPPGHPPMNSFLGVPIRTADETLGNLYLTEKLHLAEFETGDQQLVEVLATHAAIAIQNARLHARMGELAILDERARIAMDLHDGVIQSIYAVGLTLDSSLQIMGENPAEARALLLESMDGLDAAIRDIRNFIMDLRPARFEGNLNAGMARLVREFQANTLTPVETDITSEALDALMGVVARAIFFTTQEALANVARHAHASAVKIVLRREDAYVTLHVSDNGIGFDPSQQQDVVGHGLANMRARAEAFNGKLEIHSNNMSGTKITLRIPL
ncbi:MAG: GAF domain-containing sensor histidine kinase [Anaerolineales bacterium]